MISHCAYSKYYLAHFHLNCVLQILPLVYSHYINASVVYSSNVGHVDGLHYFSIKSKIAVNLVYVSLFTCS